MAAGFVSLGQPKRAADSIAHALRLGPRLNVRRVMRGHLLAIEAEAARLAAFLRSAGGRARRRMTSDNPHILEANMQSWSEDTVRHLREHYDEAATYWGK